MMRFSLSSFNQAKNGSQKSKDRVKTNAESHRVSSSEDRKGIKLNSRTLEQKQHNFYQSWTTTATLLTGYKTTLKTLLNTLHGCPET